MRTENQNLQSFKNKCVLFAAAMTAILCPSLSYGGFQLYQAGQEVLACAKLSQEYERKLLDTENYCEGIDRERKIAWNYWAEAQKKLQDKEKKLSLEKALGEEQRILDKQKLEDTEKELKRVTTYLGIAEDKLKEMEDAANETETEEIFENTDVFFEKDH